MNEAAFVEKLADAALCSHWSEKGRGKQGHPAENLRRFPQVEPPRVARARPAREVAGAGLWVAQRFQHCD
jgi:hypothetical protein